VAKCYDQYCPIAHALDVVGERWSLLVVRELLHEGPLRYSDLTRGSKAAARTSSPPA
jgi:DNA-binding HxlR family transcriptional regulator